MRFLNRDAARLFFKCSKGAYFLGFISWSQLMDRFVALKMMSSPNDPAYISADRILRVEEWEGGDQWQYENESTSQSDNIHSSPDGLPSDFSDEDGDFLYFRAGIHTGLSNWVFHQYDDDFFPSIPHGHWNGQNYPKLDSYLGWVYQNSTQQMRVPRKSIIALWNERQFREFAQVAIDYYLTHHPSYKGWKVHNPRRIPRRR